jgi:hypothetical protein
MRRISWALLAGLLILPPGAGRAADEGPAGNWKLSLFVEGKMQLLWLVQIESADGKLMGKVLDKMEGAPKAPTSVSNIKLADGALRFTFSLGETPFQFEGQMPAGDAKVITGSVAPPNGRPLPAELERTSLKALDSYELDKETLAKAKGFEVASTAMSLLAEAGKHKAKPEEVRSWAERAYKAAEPYGPRVQTDISLDIAEALGQEDSYADVAVNFARRAERALDPKAKLPHVKRTLDALAAALKKAGKADEAKEVEARIAKLNPDIKPVPYAGRKGKSDRVVLVELFTGAQCPPCVAADKAFDALAKTYKPGEVVLLEYHEHIPGPDPLTIAAGEARLRYYFGREGATPNALFNGKPDQKAQGGGDAFDAIDKYEEYLNAINPLLEQPSKAALKATATRKGNKVEISAEAIDVAVADGVRLRLALVEEAVDYKGSNGIPSYHNVVRDMPGGVTGIAIKDRAAKQSVTVDLDELKKDAKKYLDNWAAENEAKFPGKLPEMELKNLRVVAFLQNDKTKEVLQAVQVDVKGEK